jgi:hypothetical protein
MEDRERERQMHTEEYRKLARNIATHIPSTIASSVTKTGYLEGRDKFEERATGNTAVNLKNEVVIPMCCDSRKGEHRSKRVATLSPLTSHSSFLLSLFDSDTQAV